MTPRLVSSATGSMRLISFKAEQMACRNFHAQDHRIRRHGPDAVTSGRSAAMTCARGELEATMAYPTAPLHATQPPSVEGKPGWRWPGAVVGGVLLLFIGIACGNETNSSPTATTITPTAPTSAAQAPAAPAQVTMPDDLVGKNAQLADDELRRLGIIGISYESQDAGSKVTPLLENWTVTKVEPAPGTVVLTTDTVVVTATKRPRSPAPIAPPAAPEPAPPTEPEPPRAAVDSSPSGSTGGSVGGSPYYRNCAAARAAGVAPLHRGDPGYRSALDRDGDGVACE